MQLSPDRIAEQVERLREAAKRPRTQREVREQMVAFVMGQLPESNTMSREEIEARIDYHYGLLAD